MTKKLTKAWSIINILWQEAAFCGWESRVRNSQNYKKAWMVKGRNDSTQGVLKSLDGASRLWCAGFYKMAIEFLAIQMGFPFT